MTNYIITIVLFNTETNKSVVTIRVLQNSLLFSILYLFYMAELLNACNCSNKRLNISVFIDNITILMYNLFIESNC